MSDIIRFNYLVIPRASHEPHDKKVDLLRPMIKELCHLSLKTFFLPILFVRLVQLFQSNRIL